MQLRLFYDIKLNPVHVLHGAKEYCVFQHIGVQWVSVAGSCPIMSSIGSLRAEVLRSMSGDKP